MLLRLTDVCKSYSVAGRSIVALDHVSLALAAGDFLAIQGPSGCGKSTLLMTAGTLLPPDSGVVEINGESLSGLSPAQRAVLRSQSIGFVFQQFHLVPYLSVLDNVLVPALAAGQNGRMARAQSLIERFGLNGRSEHVPAQLSSGERQRCALARALLNEPRILLADEPTGNLDADSAATVLDALREFAKGGGAVLLVTHDARAAAAAKTMLPMQNGSFAAVRSAVANSSVQE